MHACCMHACCMHAHIHTYMYTHTYTHILMHTQHQKVNICDCNYAVITNSVGTDNYGCIVILIMHQFIVF